MVFIHFPSRQKNYLIKKIVYSINRLRKIQWDQGKDGLEDVESPGDVLKTIMDVAYLPYLHNCAAVEFRVKHLQNKLPRAQECQMGQGVSPLDEASH